MSPNWASWKVLAVARRNRRVQWMSRQDGKRRRQPLFISYRTKYSADDLHQANLVIQHVTPWQAPLMEPAQLASLQWWTSAGVECAAVAVTSRS